jgi:hypothetical protein
LKDIPEGCSDNKRKKRSLSMRFMKFWAHVTLFFFCFMIFAPGLVMAYCDCGPAIMQQTTTLTQAIESSTLKITGVDGSLSGVERQIKSLGDALLKKDATVEKAKLEALRELLLQIEAAKLEAATERKVSTSAQSFNACHARDGAAAYGVGKVAAAGMQRDFEADKLQWADGKFNTSREAMDKNLKASKERINGETPEGEWTFPSSGIIDSPEAVARAQEAARQVVNPYPTPKIASGAQDSLSGQEAAYAQEVKLNRLAVANGATAAIIADQTGSIDAGAIIEQLQQSMGFENANRAVDKEQRTSKLAFFDVLSDARFGNVNWFKNMVEATEPIKVMREMAYMQAQQMEMQRIHLVYEMRNTHLLSTLVALLVERNDANIQNLVNPARMDGTAATKK